VSIRVLIVDDHPVVRQGLAAMLAPVEDLEIVADTGSGRVALTYVEAGGVDVALVDLRMPDISGWELTRSIVAADATVRVLILTTYDGEEDILRAVEAGATGYLLKDTALATLVDAIRSAARGETVLAPTILAKLTTRRAGGPAVSLSERELQVLAAVSEGLTNAAVGQRLHIGEATVKTHLARIFAKLEVDDRTAAVTRAMEAGLLGLPGGRAGQ
jgi:DNA-binding NarL/FixJ family response regulator